MGVFGTTRIPKNLKIFFARAFGAREALPMFLSGGRAPKPGVREPVRLARCLLLRVFTLRNECYWFVEHFKAGHLHTLETHAHKTGSSTRRKIWRRFLGGFLTCELQKPGIPESARLGLLRLSSLLCQHQEVSRHISIHHEISMFFSLLSHCRHSRCVKNNNFRKTLTIYFH